MTQDMLLLWLIVAPVIGALVCLPFSDRLAKVIALITSLVGVALAFLLYFRFDGANSQQFQMSYVVNWIASYNIRFAIGIDGISLPLVLLTKWMMPVALLASWGEKRHVRAYMVSFLLLDAAMTATFLSTDIILFYLFWEAMLIPMMLLIGVWGSAERIYAALKFFIFTFAGSLLMLVAIFFVLRAYHQQFGVYTTDIATLYQSSFAKTPVFWGFNAEQLIFLAFTLAFAIKVPLFPLHTWLPDAHVQAPTGGSVLLAAVLLKMGAYGLLRFSIPLCPTAFIQFTPLLAALSLIGLLYGAWVAFQQTDMKKLVAYSSVSHLAIVVLGLCTWNREGLTGSVLQMVNHGLSTGALFLLVGILYERRHTRAFKDYGGIASTVPVYAFFLVFIACSSMGVPGLNGFVGEFLVLFGAFRANPVWGYIAVLGVIFGAVYMLSMVRQVLFGPNTSAENKNLKDMSMRDWCAIVPLCVFIVWLGVAPNFLLRKVDPTLDNYWKTSLKKSEYSASLTSKVNRS